MDKVELFIVLASFILTTLNLGYFVYLFTQFRKLKKGQKRLKSAALNIYQAASLKAEELIKRAVSSSLKIKEDLKTGVEEELKKIARAEVEKLELETTDLNKVYDQLVEELEEKVVENLEKTASDNLEDFKTSFKKATLEKQRQLSNQVSSEYKDINKELSEYKRKQIAQIDRLVKEQVAKISQQVLGRAISLTEHQRLIDEAIEKAIEEEMFRV